MSDQGQDNESDVSANGVEIVGMEPAETIELSDTTLEDGELETEAASTALGQQATRGVETDSTALAAFVPPHCRVGQDQGASVPSVSLGAAVPSASLGAAPADSADSEMTEERIVTARVEPPIVTDPAVAAVVESLSRFDPAIGIGAEAEALLDQTSDWAASIPEEDMGEYDPSIPWLTQVVGQRDYAEIVSHPQGMVKDGVAGYLGPPLPIQADWIRSPQATIQGTRAMPYRGSLTIPQVKPNVTLAPASFPLVTNHRDELGFLLHAWAQCDFVCPMLGCEGHTPTPTGAQPKGDPIRAKANKWDVKTNGALKRGLPRSDDFLVHFYAVHRAKGFTVFYPCQVQNCSSVFGKWGNYTNHCKRAHGIDTSVPKFQMDWKTGRRTDASADRISGDLAKIDLASFGLTHKRFDPNTGAFVGAAPGHTQAQAPSVQAAPKKGGGPVKNVPGPVPGTSHDAPADEEAPNPGSRSARKRKKRRKSVQIQSDEVEEVVEVGPSLVGVASTAGGVAPSVSVPDPGPGADVSGVPPAIVQPLPPGMPRIPKRQPAPAAAAPVAVASPSETSTDGPVEPPTKKLRFIHYQGQLYQQFHTPAVTDEQKARRAKAKRAAKVSRQARRGASQLRGRGRGSYPQYGGRGGGAQAQNSGGYVAPGKRGSAYRGRGAARGRGQSYVPAAPQGQHAMDAPPVYMRNRGGVRTRGGGGAGRGRGRGGGNQGARQGPQNPPVGSQGAPHSGVVPKGTAGARGKPAAAGSAVQAAASAEAPVPTSPEQAGPSISRQDAAATWSKYHRAPGAPAQAPVVTAVPSTTTAVATPPVSGMVTLVKAPPMGGTTIAPLARNKRDTALAKRRVMGHGTAASTLAGQLMSQVPLLCSEETMSAALVEVHTSLGAFAIQSRDLMVTCEEWADRSTIADSRWHDRIFASRESRAMRDQCRLQQMDISGLKTDLEEAHAETEAARAEFATAQASVDEAVARHQSETTRCAELLVMSTESKRTEEQLRVTLSSVIKERDQLRRQLDVAQSSASAPPAALFQPVGAEQTAEQDALRERMLRMEHVLKLQHQAGHLTHPTGEEEDGEVLSFEDILGLHLDSAMPPETEAPAAEARARPAAQPSGSWLVSPAPGSRSNTPLTLEALQSTDPMLGLFSSGLVSQVEMLSSVLPTLLNSIRPAGAMSPSQFSNLRRSVDLPVDLPRGMVFSDGRPPTGTNLQFGGASTSTATAQETRAEDDMDVRVKEEVVASLPPTKPNQTSMGDPPV